MARQRRGHGEGSVYARKSKRADGTTRTSYAYLLPPNLVGPGQRGYGGGFKTERAARDALRERITAAERGTYVKGRPDTLQVYAETVFLPKERAQRRPATVAGYEQMLNVHVFPHLGAVRLQAVTPVHLQQLWTRLAEGDPDKKRAPLKPKTIRLVYGVVRKLFADAEAQQLVVRNPALASNPPSRESADPPPLEVWTAEQLEAFLEFVRTSEQPEAAAAHVALRTCRTCSKELPVTMFNREPKGRDGYKLDCRSCAARRRSRRSPRAADHTAPHYSDDPMFPLLLLAARTGMRRGELCGLRWADVDLDDRTVTIVQQYSSDTQGNWTFSEPKTKRSRRTIPLADDAAEALRSHRRRQGERRRALGTMHQADLDLVFAQADGAPLPPDGVMRRFKQLVRDAELPALKFHGIRHTVATIASERDIAAASALLGHHDPAFTIRQYVHTDIDRMRRLVSAPVVPTSPSAVDTGAAALST